MNTAKCIGENLNIVSKKYGTALKERDGKTLQELAAKMDELGMSWIDLNIGPAGKMGEELMSWLVPVVHEVTDLPLALDTSNIKAIEAGLKAHKKGRAMINSIMVRPERMDALLPLAKEYDADFVALLWGPEGMPRDENERASLCYEIYYKATEEYGIAPERLFVDPIQTPVNVQQNQIMSALAFFEMLEDIAPGVNSTCGLSNVSNGPPDHLRPILNQTMMLLWLRRGMTSAITDAFDTKLTSIMNGEREDLAKIVWGVEDDENINPDDLDEEKLQFYKTARVLLGKSLYSDSWLEL